MGDGYGPKKPPLSPDAVKRGWWCRLSSPSIAADALHLNYWHLSCSPPFLGFDFRLRSNEHRDAVLPILRSVFELGGLAIAEANGGCLCVRLPMVT